MREGFRERANEFLNRLQTMSDTYFTEKHPKRAELGLTNQKFSFEYGSKYVRVVAEDSGKRVHCFLNTENGDILKAASWKSPAKHARGNIFTDDYGLGGTTVWGAVYLR